MIGSTIMDNSTKSENHKTHSPVSNSIPEFVKKLFGMLEDNTYPQIFSWGAEGDTFVVKDPNEFARHILPKHFKHSNFASFVRQLNKYDFHKLRMPEDGQRIYGDQAWEFQHPNFKYNRRELLEDIKRKPTGKAAAAAAAAAAGVGNGDAGGGGTVNGTQHSNSNLEEELKSITASLQKEINHLKETQKKMTDKVKSFDKKYNLVLDNIEGFKKNMEDQDALMKEMMAFVSKQNSNSYASEVDNIIHSYNNVANTGEAQLNRLSEAVGVPTMAATTATTANTVMPQNDLQQQLQQQQHQIQLQLQQQQQQMVSVPGAATNNSMVPVIHASAPSRKRKRLQVGWTVPPKVLLVDDDSIFRRLSTRLLQMAGCTIDVAVDGMEAVGKLNKGRYDLVLMDIMMPKLDGMSATRNIRLHDTWTPIISMTSNTTARDIEQYINSGMTDVLPKPFNQGSLGNLLERYCAHLVSQRQHQQHLQLLQQNHSLNSTLVDLNNIIPHLTVIDDGSGSNNNNEDKGKGKLLPMAVDYNPTAATTTATATTMIPQLQQINDQQQWYLYANQQKRSKIEDETSL